MATIDVGKIKFVWRGAYSASAVYTADDVVSYGGSSWVAVNAGTMSGTTPVEGSSWNLMADGANPMTTAGDMIFGGSSGTATRLPIGASGSVLKATSSTAVGWGTTDGLEGWGPLGTNIPKHAHTTDSDVTVSRPWLARYAGKSGASADYIPYSGMPNTDCSPARRGNNGDYAGGVSWTQFFYLNTNHEFVARGYSWNGSGATVSGIATTSGPSMAIHSEFGGLLAGEYFVRVWYKYRSMYALTNKGNVFVRGENTDGCLGLGDIVDRHQWVRNPFLGPQATNNSITCEVSTLVIAGNTIASSNDKINAFAILHDGRVLAWGENSSGSLGLGDAVQTNTPELINNLASVDIVTIRSGYNATLFLDSAGDVWSTGADTTGINLGTARTAPVKMGGIDNVVILQAHLETTYCAAMAIQTDGDMYALGYNGSGSLGLGDTTQRSAWTQTGGSLTFSHVVLVSSGTNRSSVALAGVPGDLFDTTGKTVYVCGENNYGQLGQGSTTDSTSWLQPSATSYGTSYLRTVTTADGSINSSSNMTFPRTSVVDIFDASMQEAAGLICYTDSQARFWYTGNFYRMYGFANHTGTEAVNLPFMYPSPWSHSLSSGTHYNGNSQVTVIDYFIGHDASSMHAIWVILGSDNSLWYLGEASEGITGPVMTATPSGNTGGLYDNVHWKRLGAA